VKVVIGLLGLLGILAMVFAGFCVVSSKPWEVDSGFLATGALFLLVAVFLWVFHSRMEGEQKFKLPGGAEVTINLGKLYKEKESEIKAGDLTLLSEKKKERR
jgi:hypothetical protein